MEKPDTKFSPYKGHTHLGKAVAGPDTSQETKEISNALSDNYKEPLISVLSKMALTAKTPLARTRCCSFVFLLMLQAANSHLRLEKNVLMTVESIGNALIIYSLFFFSFKVFCVVLCSFL